MSKPTKYREEIDKKTPLKRPKYYLKKVSLEKQRKRLLNVIERDIRKLLDKSEFEPLNRDEAQQVCNYLKVIMDLEKKQKEDLSSLTDEELEKLMNESKSSS